MRKLLLASNNKNKLREFRQTFEGTEWKIVSPDELGISHEVDEDSDTFEGNALKKAEEFMKISGLPTIADDSGIMADALDGKPGVYSARFASDNGGNAQDEANNDKLLTLMKDKPDRGAQYVCALAAVFPDKDSIIITETCRGEIAFERSGSGGFGYDVIFYLPEYGCTMAGIPAEEKNKISHRGKAVRKLAEKLKEVSF